MYKHRIFILFVTLPWLVSKWIMIYITNNWYIIYPQHIIMQNILRLLERGLVISSLWLYQTIGESLPRATKFCIVHVSCIAHTILRVQVERATVYRCCRVSAGASLMQKLWACLKEINGVWIITVSHLTILKFNIEVWSRQYNHQRYEKKKKISVTL